MANMTELEPRYLVFKVSDLGNSMKGDEVRKLHAEYQEDARPAMGKQPLDGIFIEANWPEYEPLKAALLRRINQEQQVLVDPEPRSSLVKPLEPFLWVFRQYNHATWEVVHSDGQLKELIELNGHGQWVVKPLYDLGDGKIVSSRT